MTADRLREIEERAEAATPGPWFRDEYQSGTIYVRIATDFSAQFSPPEHPEAGKLLGAYVVHGERPPGVDGPDYQGQRKANGDFIAHARTDIPWLVNQLRRHQAALLLAREQRNEYVPEYDQVSMDEDIAAILEGEGEA